MQIFEVEKEVVREIIQDGKKKYCPSKSDRYLSNKSSHWTIADKSCILMITAHAMRISLLHQ